MGKQVAGPPEMTDDPGFLWTTGRCAMTISESYAYTQLQTPLFDGTIGTAIMPGSEKVWSRERKEMVVCNMSFCRHATEYQDGLVVNHAPFGSSLLDGLVSGQIERAQQLAAYTFLTWLMKDANVVEGVVSGNLVGSFGGTFVKPSLFVPSVWTPYGFGDPALSMYCGTQTTNMEHPNAGTGPRLPNSVEYYAAVQGV